MQVIITNAGKRSKNQVFLTNCGGLILVSCQTPSQPLSLSLLNSMERKEVGKAHGSCWYDQGCRWKPAPPHGLHELQSSPCLTAWGSIPAHPLWELAGLCHASSLALCAVFCPFSNTFPWRCCLSPVHSGLRLSSLRSWAGLCTAGHRYLIHTKNPHFRKKILLLSLFLGVKFKNINTSQFCLNWLCHCCFQPKAAAKCCTCFCWWP